MEVESNKRGTAIEFRVSIAHGGFSLSLSLLEEKEEKLESNQRERKKEMENTREKYWSITER